MCLLCAEWQRLDYIVFISLLYLRHAVLRQIAVQQQPFFVLLRQHSTQKPGYAFFVGEDTAGVVPFTSAFQYPASGLGIRNSAHRFVSC